MLKNFPFTICSVSAPGFIRDPISNHHVEESLLPHAVWIIHYKLSVTGRLCSPLRYGFLRKRKKRVLYKLEKMPSCQNYLNYVWGIRRFREDFNFRVLWFYIILCIETYFLLKLLLDFSFFILRNKIKPLMENSKERERKTIVVHYALEGHFNFCIKFFNFSFFQ